MKKILVIDDERDVLEVVRSVLKTKGYSVRCAEGGEEGLRQAEAEKFDLFIIDLMMPRISGMELIKRLKANEKTRSVPIIVLSAVGADEDRPSDFWARGLGVEEYIGKPFEPLDLLGRVEYLFRRSGYISTREGDRTPRPIGVDGAAERVQHAKVDFPAASPSEVARAYIEAWNNRDWTTEYQCMDQEIMGNFPLAEYVARRDESYAEDEGHRRKQRLASVSDEYISGNLARVSGTREDTVEGQTKSTNVTITLKKTNKGWKIIRIKDDTMTPKPR